MAAIANAVITALILIHRTVGISKEFCDKNKGHAICQMFGHVKGIKGNVNQLHQTTGGLHELFQREINDTEIVITQYMKMKMKEMLAAFDPESCLSVGRNAKAIVDKVRKLNKEGACPKGCCCKDGCVTCGDYTRCDDDLKDKNNGTLSCSSGAQPMAKNGTTFNCASNSCPLGMSCETSDNGTQSTMACCPKAVNVSSYARDAKCGCPMQGKSKYIDSDCRSKVCPKDYCCTIIDDDTRTCLYGAMDKDVKVDVLIEGDMRRYGKVIMKRPTVTLISTKSGNVLVDFGMPADAIMVLRKMLKKKITPSQITFGIATGMNLWNAGGLALFPETPLVLPDGITVMGDQVWPNPLTDKGSFVVHPNIEIITMDQSYRMKKGISVVVYNVDQKGTVVIAGTAIKKQKWLDKMAKKYQKMKNDTDPDMDDGVNGTASWDKNTTDPSAMAKDISYTATGMPGSSMVYAAVSTGAPTGKDKSYTATAKPGSSVAYAAVSGGASLEYTASPGAMGWSSGYSTMQPGWAVDGVNATLSDLNADYNVTSSGQDGKFRGRRRWYKRRFNIESVKKIVCIANYIVPGCGPMFKVTESYRRSFDC